MKKISVCFITLLSLVLIGCNFTPPNMIIFEIRYLEDNINVKVANESDSIQFWRVMITANGSSYYTSERRCINAYDYDDVNVLYPKNTEYIVWLQCEYRGNWENIDHKTLKYIPIEGE